MPTATSLSCKSLSQTAPADTRAEAHYLLVVCQPHPPRAYFIALQLLWPSLLMSRHPPILREVYLRTLNVSEENIGWHSTKP
jgi:hypothetical protein